MRLLATFCILLFLTASAPRAADPAEESFGLAKVLLLERQEYDTAARKLGEFLQAYPRHARSSEALYYIAYCRMRLNDNPGAGEAYERLLTEYPDAAEKTRQEAMRYGGDAWFKAGKFDRSIALYTKLLESFPESPLAQDALFWRATAYDRLGLALRQAGNIPDAVGQARLAIADFDAYARRYPASKQTPSALRNAGFVALDAADPATAERFFSRLVQEVPDDSRAEEHAFYLAESLYRQQRYEEARAAFEKVLRAFPTGRLAYDARSSMAWCDYEGARVLEAAGKMQDAVRRVASAAQGFVEAASLTQDPDQQLRARYDAGRAYRKAGDLEKAAEQMTAVADAGKTTLRGPALFNLGAFRLEQARAHGALGEGRAPAQQQVDLLKQAVEALRQALADPSIGNDAPEAATFLGEACLDLQDYVAAETAFASVAERWPQDERAPLALYHLALARGEQKKYEEAGDAIRQLLERHKDSRLRVKAAYVMADYQVALGKPDKGRLAYQWIADKGVAWAEAWRDAAGQPDPALVQSAKDLAADSLFRLGESFYLNDRDLEKAGAAYAAVVANYAESVPAPMARLRLGEIAEARQDHATALVRYREALESKDPAASRSALYQLGALQWTLAQQAAEEKDRLARLRESLSHLDRFLQAYGKDELAPRALYYRGEVLYGLKEHEKAVVDYAAAVEAAPDGPLTDAALYGLGWSQRELGRNAESRDAFRTLATKFEKSVFRPEALYLLALAEHQNRAHEIALELCETLLRDHADDPYAVKGLLEKARVLDDMGRPAAAIDIFESFLKRHPQHEDAPWAMYNLSYAHWRLVEPLLTKVREAQAALASAPESDRDALQKKLDAARAEARAAEDRMASVLTRLVEAYPNFPMLDTVWLRLGEMHYDRGAYEDALAAYEKAIASSRLREGSDVAPKARYRQAWSRLRLAEKSAGAEAQKKAALEAFEALAQEQNGGLLAQEALFRAAELRREIGDHKAALPLYENYLKTDHARQAETIFRRAAGCGRGICLLEMRQDQTALAAFRTFLKDFPDGEFAADAHWGAGQASLHLQAHADAREHFQKAVELGDTREAAARARLGLGLVAMQQKDWEAAREEFLKVDAFHGQWPRWVALALVKSSEAALALGQPEKARADLQRVLDRYQDTPAAKDAAKRLAEMK